MKSTQEISRIALFLFIVIIQAGCGYEKDAAEELELTQTTVLPGDNTVISGIRMLVIEYDIRKERHVKDVTYDIGQGPVSLINDTNGLYHEPGAYSIKLCAECLDAAQVKVAVSFAEEDKEAPISRSYTIDRWPMVAVSHEINPENGDVVLDASATADPEGRPVTFSWRQGDRISEGPVFETSAELLYTVPLFLVISDEVNRCPFFLLAPDDEDDDDDDDEPADPFKALNEFLEKAFGKGMFESVPGAKCIGMTIATSGPSMINPGITLGPDPAVGTQLDLTPGTKQLSREYAIGYFFEVRGTLDIADEANMIEGQEVAGTMEYSVGGKRIKSPKKGKLRNPDNPQELIGEPVETPYPDEPPVPAPPNLPPMAEDNYETHPTDWMVNKNGATGVESVSVNLKDLVFGDGDDMTMVWFDKPGLSRLPVGFDISDGIKIRGFFRGWMMPDLEPCEKFFILKIDVDGNGVVTKSQIAVLF